MLLVGCVVTAGTVCTVNVAALVVMLPTELVKSARYCLPVSANAVVKEYGADVAPEMSVHDVPSVLTCHFTVGVGVPMAAAVNVAVVPFTAVVLEGLVCNRGGSG